MVENLASVSDFAESGTIQDFSTNMKDEVQKQCLLQMVELHRKNFPDCNRHFGSSLSVL